MSGESGVDLEKERRELLALRTLAEMPAWKDPGYGLARVLAEKAEEAEAQRNARNVPSGRRDEWLEAYHLTKELAGWLAGEIGKREARIAAEEKK